jgi:patatin-like phospholipase/acyl hydrolase
MEVASKPFPFRVLAIDGGGMRGVYSATVIESFARHFAARRGVDQLDVGKGFDLIVGTSIGGIIACALAFGLTPTDIIELFRRVGPALFRRPVPQSRLGFAWWVVRSLRQSANSDRHLREVLEDRFGGVTLNEVFRRRKIALCIPSVNISTGRSLVFKTPHFEHLTRDREFRLVDVCLSTSAAPIYLPLASVNDPGDPAHKMILADGGLWANNPVLVGLIEALSLAGRTQPIQILSVSACPMPLGEVASERTRNWGILKWKAGTGALAMALESQAWGQHYMAAQLANVLRDNGRECYVIRVPHTSPSIAQAPYVGLDRASPKALRILGELGRLDGDFDAAVGGWASPIISAMVAEMFLDMPSAIGRARANAERRMRERIVHNLPLGAGLVLRDQSAYGACFVISGPAPQLGAHFVCAGTDGPINGYVRWVQQLENDSSLFGIETTPIGVTTN